MEKCKFCQAELEEGVTLCPACGKENAAEAAAEETAAEQVAAEETVTEEVAAEETAPAEETAEEAAPAEETAEEAAPAEETAEEAAPAEETAEEAAPAEETAEEAAPAEETAEEAAPAEEAAEETAPAEGAAEEAAPAEETAAEERPEETKDAPKATSGKIAMLVVAIVVVLAVIVALLMTLRKDAPQDVQDTTAAVETTEAIPTIPADGNPDDETCKGTYTVDDATVQAAADTVVATVNGHELTNGQLQVFYWMQVQSFLSSEYGYYMTYYGALDYAQGLDTQICAMTGTGTWQQFFLAEALNTWQNYVALADEAEKSGMTMSAEDQAFLDNVEANLNASAESMGLKDAAELLARNVGAGASMEDYKHFQRLLMMGNQYYDAECAKIEATPEALNAFFTEHEAEYAESGITREGKFVDVRHILLIPQGGTTDDSGVTTYSEAEWAECKDAASMVLNQWLQGAQTEQSFADLANEISMDPGSNTNGGLYENVKQGDMVPEFDAWCFDEKRESGHSGMVKTDYGYHLMYFVGSTPIWQYYAEQDFLSTKSGEMVEALVAQYPMEVSYSDIVLSFVDMAG